MSASMKKSGSSVVKLIVLICIIDVVTTDEHSIGSKLEAEKVQRKRYDDHKLAFTIFYPHTSNFISTDSVSTVLDRLIFYRQYKIHTCALHINERIPTLSISSGQVFL